MDAHGNSEFNMPAADIAKRLSPDARLQLVGQPTGLTPRQANAITQARLQYSLSALAEGNVDNVNKWLAEVGARAPAEAIRLFMELLEFRMPRMKAATVIATLSATGDGGKQMKDMTIEELESIVSES